MKFKDPITDEYKTLHLKTGDTLPVGTIVSFEGDEIPEGYEEVIGEEARVVISPTEPTTGEEVWLQKGKNLFDYNNIAILSGLTQNNKEFLFDSANYYGAMQFAYDYKINKPYTFSFNIIETSILAGATVVFYYYDGTYTEKNIDGLAVGKHSITVTPTKEVKLADLRVFRLNNNTTQRTGKVTDIQVEQGETSTSYEEYINKKIYTKNDNGVYEEFLKEEVILYNDKNGDNTSITLSDNVRNYKSLEIMYKAEDVYGYAKIFEPNDKKIALDINVSFASTNYYKISKWEIKNNQINFLTGNAYDIGTDGVSGITENNKQVHIVKVVGYK